MSQQAEPENQAVTRSGAPPAAAGGMADDLLAVAALLLMTVATGESRLSGVALSHEMTVAIAAARAFGATVAVVPDGLVVSGLGTGVLLEPTQSINVTGAPLTAALMSGLVSSHEVAVTVIGAEAKALATLLLPIGLQIEDQGEGGVSVQGSRTPPPARWNVGAGDQVKTLAILMSALNTPGLTLIEQEGEARLPIARLFQRFGAGFSVEAGAQGKFTLRMTGRRPLTAASIDLIAFSSDDLLRTVFDPPPR